jgi:Mrp family chromosome partitioning ATPase
MKRWIDAFRSANNIDVVIIDTPPLLFFADSTIIATATDAEALLVVDSQRVHTNTALKAKGRLTEANIDIKGLILNRINPRDEVGGYYGYNYGYDYYASGREHKPERRGLFGVRR